MTGAGRTGVRTFGGGAENAAESRRAASAGRGLSARAYAAFGAFSIAVTLAFSWDGIGADFSALSSDQYNILAMCAKRDHPQLLEGDLIVGNPNDVAYYTPLFVDMVRLASLPDHDYVRGLNILLAATSLVYMWGWWFLLSVWGDVWIAALGALLVRGVMWPVGNELWGIAGIWSLVPRTLFLALLPWVLWVWFRSRGSTRGWALAAFSCGLLANVHPISGAGVAVSLMMGESAWTLVETRRLRPLLARWVVGGVAVLAGMAPYLWIYLTRVRNPVHVDPAELDRAIAMRIPAMLLDPRAYWDQWMRPQWLLLIFGPWLACLLLPPRLRKGRTGMLCGLAGFAAGSAIIPSLCFPVEHLLDEAGWHVRFAFQLIRTGKYLLVPSVVLAVWVTVTLSRELSGRWNYGRRAVPAAVCVVIALTLAARDGRFDGWPVLGDDVFRLLWPSGQGRQFPGGMNHPPEQSVSKLLPWIQQNTAPTAKFVGPRPIRAGSLRAVVHDWAGAVVLIEGNPRAFVQAAKREKLLRDPWYSDPVRRSVLLASWGADYWVTDIRTTALELVHADGNWYIYRLAKGSVSR